MAAAQKLKMDEDGEVPKVTFEDQKKINMFAQRNIELNELKAKLADIKKKLENIEDAENEIMMLDDEGDDIPFQIGEVFVENSPEATQELLDKLRDMLKQRAEDLESKEGEIVGIMKDLKTHLYAKFGDNINLES